MNTPNTVSYPIAAFSETNVCACGAHLEIDQDDKCAPCQAEDARSATAVRAPALASFDLPPDPENMNDERSAWAAVALEAFQDETRTDDEDAVADLLCDLRHWCDRNGMDFRIELARAMNHYREETSE